LRRRGRRRRFWRVWGRRASGWGGPLPEDQADWLETAIADHHRVKKLLAEMRTLSRQIMRRRFPDTERRSPLNKKVLPFI